MLAVKSNFHKKQVYCNNLQNTEAFLMFANG